MIMTLWLRIDTFITRDYVLGTFLSHQMELSASNAVMSMNADYFDLWTTNNISSREWLNMQDGK